MACLEFPGSEPSDWLDAMPKYAATVVEQLLASGVSYEQAAELWLTRVGADSNAPFGARQTGPSFYESVKAELAALLCGGAAYEELRARVKQEWDKQKSRVAYVIAGGIAVKVGVAAAVVLPVIALMLAAITQVGVAAWCRT